MALTASMVMSIAVTTTVVVTSIVVTTTALAPSLVLPARRLNARCASTVWLVGHVEQQEVVG